MKKVILNFTLLVLGNLLCLKYAFVQDDMRFMSLLGFIVVAISVFNFSAKLAGLFIKRDFSLSEIYSPDATKNKALTKPVSITLFSLFLLISIHVIGYLNFFKYQDNLLMKDGIFTKAVVIDKKWEKRCKSCSSKYYVYYKYVYQGKTFYHSYSNSLNDVGDSLLIFFLPQNPDNHNVTSKTP